MIILLHCYQRIKFTFEDDVRKADMLYISGAIRTLCFPLPRAQCLAVSNSISRLAFGVELRDDVTAIKSMAIADNESQRCR